MNISPNSNNWFVIKKVFLIGIIWILEYRPIDINDITALNLVIQNNRVCPKRKFVTSQIKWYIGTFFVYLDKGHLSYKCTWSIVPVFSGVWLPHLFLFLCTCNFDLCCVCLYIACLVFILLNLCSLNYNFYIIIVISYPKIHITPYP